jgi:hypothetical protein
MVAPAISVAIDEELILEGATMVVQLGRHDLLVN